MADIAAAFFGYGKEEDRMFIPYPTGGAPDVPIVALRSVQLYTAVDIPTKISMVTPPGAAVPETQSTWTIGLRVAFDWRYYLGSGTGGHR